ncbi:MAG TPA: hypothetical protein ACFYD3_07375 [Candidatus Hypogeohydataceae bacterium YC41]
MKKDFIIEDRTPGGATAFKLLQNATRIGGFAVGDAGVVPTERVLPEQRFPHQPLFPQAIMETPKKVYAYFHRRGYILAADGLKEDNASVDYKSYKLVRVMYSEAYLTQTVNRWLVKHPNLDRNYLLNIAPMQLKELEKKFFEAGGIGGLTEDEAFAMRLYFLNANNFSPLKRGAGGVCWWATRTHLWTGRLKDGLKVQEPAIVQGVPNDQNINGRYHHVLGVFVWKSSPLERGAGGVYKMLTEEQVITERGLPQVFIPHQYFESNANFRVLLNVYESQDALNWSFAHTYAEDATEDPVKERIFMGYAGNQILWKYIYKDPAYGHYKDGIPTNLPVDKDRPSGRHYRIVESRGGVPKFEARASFFQTALHKYLSSDGLDWQFQWTKVFTKGTPL